MEQRLSHFGAQLVTGPGEPSVLVLGGACLFVVLGIYAGLLLNRPQLPAWLQPPQPATLRGRLVLALAVSASLPAVALALVLAGQLGDATTANTSMEEYAIAFGWLMATIIIALCLAIALATSIADPMQALEKHLGESDLDPTGQPTPPPADTPREIAAVLQYMGSLATRLGAANDELHRAARQAERLRRELTDVIGNREIEIRSRTEELCRAKAELEQINRLDALTGVANRRELAEFLDREWRNAMREQKPVSLIVVDIDHFRAYNERSGTQKGDTCLKAVAEALRQVASRPSDLVCRHGSDDFVVVLGNTPLDGALEVAEQLRSAIQGLAIPHPDAPGEKIVTVSVGASSAVPARHGRAERLLSAAERAVHTAKELGRNQVAYSTTARTGLYQSLCLPNDVTTARVS
jgi:diguanylate cyclase (GGDEF)-like protein